MDAGPPKQPEEGYIYCLSRDEHEVVNYPNRYPSNVGIFELRDNLALK